jgi:hypothetical protein
VFVKRARGEGSVGKRRVAVFLFSAVGSVFLLSLARSLSSLSLSLSLSKRLTAQRHEAFCIAS